MASTRDYVAGARAMGRRDGPAGVRAFFARHGVRFVTQRDDVSVSFGMRYAGTDRLQAVTAVRELIRTERPLMLDLVNLVDREAEGATR
jgi:hypothetical protein